MNECLQDDATCDCSWHENARAAAATHVRINAPAHRECLYCGAPDVGSTSHYCSPVMARVFTVQRVPFDVLIDPPRKHRASAHPGTESGWKIELTRVEGDCVVLVWGCVVFVLLERAIASSEATP